MTDASATSQGCIERGWGEFAYLRRRGRGRPIVLMHPLAMGARLWEPVWADFGADRDIIAVDFRGQGQSAWNGEPYVIEDLAGDVIALMDALDIERADLVGMSMGGCVAIATAGHDPSRIGRLALCDTTAWYGADAPEKWQERARMAEDPDRSKLRGFQMVRWFTEGFLEEHADAAEAAFEVFLATLPQAHVMACLALGKFDGRALLSRVTAPSLVITGEEDYAAPPDMGRALAAGIAGASFHLWKGVRHFSLIESPELRRFVGDFLAQTTP